MSTGAGQIARLAEGHAARPERLTTNGDARAGADGAVRGRPAAARRGAIHVMHVVHTFQPAGMELGVLKIVNGLDPVRVRSSVCSTRLSAPAMRERLAPGVRLFDLGAGRGNDLRVVRALYGLFRRERPHVVHTHAWGTLIEGWIAARLASVPVLIHGEHGTLQLRTQQRWCQRIAWSRVDRLLSVSSRLAERMARDVGVPLDRIQTLHNGVDLSRFGRIERAEARQALGLPASALIVVAVGRLVPVKDHRLLLDAAAQLRRNGHDFTLAIAGDGPLAADLHQRAATLGVSPHVRFLGHRPDVERVLAAGDVFVQSSRSEGLSNTILEAMASGLPVVATHVGGTDEMVIEEATGLLVPAGDAAALAGAIGRLLADRDLREALGRAGRTRARTTFDLASAVGRYQAMYLELVEAAS